MGGIGARFAFGHLVSEIPHPRLNGGGMWGCTSLELVGEGQARESDLVYMVLPTWRKWGGERGPGALQE